MTRTMKGLLASIGLAGLLGFAGAATPVVQANEAAPTIPLCPGLTIVTAINQPDGDYESIKTIESVTDDAVRLKYSSERMVEDWLDMTVPPKLVKTTMYRSVRRHDLRTATSYLQQFQADLPETVPETTAIGVSRAVLEALKKTGETDLGIFIAFSQETLTIDRNVHPNVYDNQMVTKVARVVTAPRTLPVIVNGQRTELPVVVAAGDFYGDQSEFYFLDDPDNPLTLTFRIGIRAISQLDAEFKALMGQKLTAGGDKETLRVVKISHRCGAPVPTTRAGGGATAGGGGDPAGAPASALERALADSGRAEVYDIFFTFNSAEIRPESERTLQEIAALLRERADWKLTIEGHTDNIASDGFNLDLSKRRSASVKEALVKRFGIDAARLTTTGLGKTRPRDTNDTLEGRARNRRVELVRLP